MTYHIALYLIILISAVMAVMSRKLLTSAIMLGVMSVAVSLLLFNFSSPWAAVFELSVCAGLITVLFISAVSLMKKEDELFKESRMKFALLPVFVAAAAILDAVYFMPYLERLTDSGIKVSEFNPKVGDIIWNYRGTDLIGQLTLLACAVFVIKLIFQNRRIEE